MSKRKEMVEGGASVDPEDKLEIIPLGAGNEVGRSCVFVSFKGKNVLVSCLFYLFSLPCARFSQKFLLILSVTCSV